MTTLCIQLFLQNQPHTCIYCCEAENLMPVKNSQYQMDNFCLLSIRLKINTHTFTSHFGEVEHEQVCGVSCRGKAFSPQITQCRSTVWCNGANMCSHPLKTDSESFFPCCTIVTVMSQINFPTYTVKLTALRTSSR